MHVTLDEVCSELYGVDIDHESLMVMKRLGYRNLFTGDVEGLEQLDLSERFDIFLAGDFLENMSSPGEVVGSAKRFLEENVGKMIILTNSAFGLHYQISRWLDHYTGRFQYVYSFSPGSMRNLFERHGYVVTKLYGAYTVPLRDWMQKLMFAIGKPLFGISPVWAGTLVVVAATK